MQIFEQLHQFNKQILFEEETHTYKWINDPSIKLTSVTTHVAKFFPKINWEYWRVYKALQTSFTSLEIKSHNSSRIPQEHIALDGVLYFYKDVVDKLNLSTTPDMIAKQWNDRKIIGTNRGTAAHLYAEQRILGKITKQEHLIPACKNHIDNFVNDHPHLIPISLEQIVGCPDIGLAGQIDCLFYNSLTNTYQIWDYKTDKKLEFESFRRQTTLLPPFEDMQACNVSKYTLQLSIYRQLLIKHTDLNIDNTGYIIWINEDQPNYKIVNINLINNPCQQ